MNFQDFKDESFEYSEGETSEDMRIQNNNSNFVSNKFSGYLPLEQHIKTFNINTLKNREEIENFEINQLEFNFEDFLKKKHFENEEQIFTTESVIFIMAHSAQFNQIDSDYFNLKPLYFCWQNIYKHLSNDFNSNCMVSYKTQYHKLRPQIRFIPLVSPSFDKLNGLVTYRKDIILGRVLFHFIGHGFPTIDKNSIYICDGKHNKFRHYPLYKIFENLNTL